MINFSVADDEHDTRIIEPWFLNAVNKLSNSNVSIKVLKIDAFDRSPLGGFKGDETEYKRYVGRTGSEIYWRLIENVVESLEARGFIRRHNHPAYVLITREGINMCNREGEDGWHSMHYPIDGICSGYSVVTNISKVCFDANRVVGLDKFRDQEHQVSNFIDKCVMDVIGLSKIYTSG